MKKITLIEKVLNGDPVAKRDLIKQHHLTLKKIILKYAGNEHCDDILQETWINIFKNIHSFKHQSDIQTWMVRIAINAANHFHNKSAQLRTNQNIDDQHDLFHENGSWKHPLHKWSHSASPEEIHSSDQLSAIIDREIAALPEQQKAVLTLHDIENINFEKICNILDISNSNVRVLLHRARQQILVKVDAFYKEQQC